MTLATVFYTLGIIYFVVLFIILIGVIIGAVVLYRRIQKLKATVASNAVLLGISRVIGTVSNKRFAPMLSMLPMAFSLFKMFQSQQKKRS